MPSFWVDVIRGTTTIIIIMIVAGGIAYVGDRVGHQVGRKRLTLFGIRPRYTSTIVAIGTGMLIALIVTLIALLFSQQVKNALFRMNQISARITELQTQEQSLESKVNNGQLVQPVDALMFPYFLIIPKGEPVDTRMSRIKAFYGQAVEFINSNYTLAPFELKRFVAPPDLDRRLAQRYGTPEVTAASQLSDLMMMVMADQNLYKGDQVHFSLTLIDDQRRFPKGAPVGSLRIPGGPNADPNLAVYELEQQVASSAHDDAKLPPPLANNVQVVQTFPSVPEMKAMLSKPGTRYLMTAYAAEDIYPHTRGIPIVVALAAAQ